MWNNLEYVFILFDEVVHVTVNACTPLSDPEYDLHTLKSCLYYLDIC